MTDILVLEDLTVSDGNKQILSKLNLSLKDRGLTVVMGPMGAGKSTLTKFLGGLLNPDALNISFELAIYDSKSLGSGDRPLLVPQKVREKGDADSKFLLRVAEIEAIANTSGKLLCFDEPSSGLSNEDGAEIMRKLSQIAQEKAVLVISHNTEQAREFSDYIALIAG
ncbi:MAG: ATP-binding cassette domain-containing protein, partial [Methyloprofundus sp.]|nr:ATP-binding cassette domain-containing protein [Methyloprofundus sp.]